MSEQDLKISAITKKLAQLEQSKHAYETNGQYTAVIVAQMAINLYTRDLEVLCENAEKI